MKIENKIFHQYLAGLIDGDGHFFIDGTKTPRMEITMALKDEHVLQIVKQEFPGSLKHRSGAQAIRLRVSQKEVLGRLLTSINGEIRNPVRQVQMQKLCLFFNISFRYPEPLTIENGYLAGLFDSNGTVTLTVSKTTGSLSVLNGVEGKINRLQHSRGYHQLRCKITSKDRLFLESIVRGYRFGVIYDQKVNKNSKHPNCLYHWTCQSKEDLRCFLDYIQRWGRLRSQKRKRCFLIPRFWELHEQKAHLKDIESMQFRAWKVFCRKWYEG